MDYQTPIIKFIGYENYYYIIEFEDELCILNLI